MLLSVMCLSQHCLFVSDAAFVARERARADAEYYTAAKNAEANAVKHAVNITLHITPHTGANLMALKFFHDIGRHFVIAAI